MSGDIEAAGAAITAGLAAGEIQGGAGKNAPRHASGPCANCGTTLSGLYCHACGQSSHTNRSLAHVIEEAVHGLLHFDGRAWRTAPMLVFRPGTLTGDYIFGMRARYISPIALFLFVIFAMFFVFSLVLEQDPKLDIGLRDAQSITSLETGLANLETGIQQAESDLSRAKTQKGPGADGAVAGAQNALDSQKRAREDLLSALEAARARDRLYRQAQAQIEREIAQASAAGAKDDRLALQTGKALVDRAVASDGAQAKDLTITTRPDGDLDISFTADLSQPGSRSALFDQIRAAQAAGDIDVQTGNPALDERIHHKLENPELAWYKIQSTAYKFAFLLVPLSLPFVALLFAFKRGVTLYDHAVFVLYSLSFAALLVMTLTVIGRWAPGIVGPAFIASAVGFVVHLFFQLKGGYRLGWWSALWRTAVMLIFALLCLALFIAIIFVLGFLG